MRHETHAPAGRGGPGLPRRWLLVALLGLLSVPATAQPPPGRPTGPRLTDFWVRWAGDLAPLMSEAERSLFFTLDENRQRASFARAFWRSRGQAAARRWGRNSEAVDRLLLQSDRRRAALLVGKPSRTETFPRCGGLRLTDVWYFEPSAIALQGAAEPDDPLVLVFVRETSFDVTSLRPWTPGDMAALTFAPRLSPNLETALERAAASPCFEPPQLERLRQALTQASSLEELRRRAPWPAPASDWAAGWRPAAEPLWPDSEISLSFPGGFNDYTVVAGRLAIRAGRLHRLAPQQLFDRVTITGDVYRGDRLADSFAIVHHVAGTHDGPTVALEFHRRLRPGDYTLDLRAVDRHGSTLYADRLETTVPETEIPAPEPAGRARGYSHLTRPDVVVLTTFPGVELLPASAVGRGRLRLHASTTGGPIDAVEFRLDGRPVGVDDDPPYSIAIAGAADRRRAAAIALDPAGRPLARDERWVEPEERAFYTRFGEPVGGRAPVSLSLPLGAAIERLDCYHGRRRTAALTAPPWDCPLPERFAARADYLTVRAVLASGDTAEDVLFLGGGVEEIEVRLAELYLSVVDQAGRPVSELGDGDFRLSDRSGELGIESVESLANLPLNVSLLMDISSSMSKQVRTAATSAQRFFEEILEPGDLAGLQAFNQDLHQLAEPTDDATLLGHAAAGLPPRGSTRLHDAIIYSLHQFARPGSRRALILLSDGADVGSDYPFEQVLDEAMRAGVVVYPVSLGEADETTGELFEELGRRTGGRRFAVASARQLDGVLRRIAGELRAQYLLVFRPRAATPELSFRQIEVELLRPGLEARDIHGHYR